MKVKCRRGFYSVEHPQTGERIVVEEAFETDRETFELLRDEYSGFVEVRDSAENTSEPPDLECGVNGCSRTVGSPDETCWQHPQGGD